LVPSLPKTGFAPVCALIFFYFAICFDCGTYLANVPTEMASFYQKLAPFRPWGSPRKHKQYKGSEKQNKNTLSLQPVLYLCGGFRRKKGHLKSAQTAPRKRSTSAVHEWSTQRQYLCQRQRARRTKRQLSTAIPGPPALPGMRPLQPYLPQSIDDLFAPAALLRGRSGDELAERAGPGLDCDIWHAPLPQSCRSSSGLSDAQGQAWAEMNHDETPWWQANGRAETCMPDTAKTIICADLQAQVCPLPILFSAHMVRSCAPFISRLLQNILRVLTVNRFSDMQYFLAETSISLRFCPYPR